MKEKKEKTLSTRGLAPSLCFGLHVMEQIMSLPVLPLRSRCNHFEIWNESLRVIYLKQMFRLLKSTVLHHPLLYKSTLLLHATESPGIVAWATGARTCSCKRLHVHRMKTEGKDGESKRKKRQRESSAQISECVWQRGQPRRQVPALQHRKWHMTALTFVIPCLPPPPNPSLQQTLRLAWIHTHTHTLRDTQSHTVYCLDYIIFIPRTWALLVGWHLGLCSTKVTFLCPWVKDACLQHAFEMKGRGGGGKEKKKIQMRKISKSTLIRGINSHAQTC